MKISLRSAAALVSLSANLVSVPSAKAAIVRVKTHAIWVFPDPAVPAKNPVLSPAAGQQLIASARASNINMIFLSVYSSPPNANRRLMYDESKIASLVAAAHFASIEVYAAYGNTDWPVLGCGSPGSPSFPIQRVLDVAAYNAANPTAPTIDPVTGISYNSSAVFNGIILDVEPPNGADQNLLTLYQCSQQTASQHNLGLSVAISAFWDTVIGAGGPAYQQIVHMGFNNVVVMGYRNFAGQFGVVDNGMVSIDTNVVSYANSYSTVLVGLETKNLGAADADPTQSFFSLGQQTLDYQAQLVYNQFAAAGYDFGGFAIHNYADTYLSGTAAWPLTDSTFPTKASLVPVSAGTPSFVTIGSTTISVLFPNISNSNATVTVTPVNPATPTPTPSGFQLSNLAFEISTTAAFTGPATVCFRVPSIDPVGFASLRILHYVGGLPVDQTILSGPNAPDPATQTICASVTSFSPFVLAKTTTAPMSSFAVDSFKVSSNEFHLQGDFSLPAGKQLKGGDVEITLGSAVLKVPAAEFRNDDDNRRFTFEGVVNGVRLHIEMQPRRSQSYDYEIEGSKLDLTKQAEPISVKLQIGSYVGTALVFARVEK